jgi:hypothetical protein
MNAVRVESGNCLKQRNASCAAIYALSNPTVRDAMSVSSEAENGSSGGVTRRFAPDMSISFVMIYVYLTWW